MKMNPNEMYGFLHRHPNLERAKGLDENHVIVDKEDWEAARISELHKELDDENN